MNRFIQEAKAASALNHPNILTVYEIGEVDGKNYIATELIDGKTLREHLSHKESLQLNQILNIGVQVSVPRNQGATCCIRGRHQPSICAKRPHCLCASRLDHGCTLRFVTA
ncbi:MAG: protein kinase [Pyrinomonadaceae bacterium]